MQSLWFAVFIVLGIGALVNSLGELMGINTLSFDKSNDGETPEGDRKSVV